VMKIMKDPKVSGLKVYPVRQCRQWTRC
jgi:hypothetical protein